MSDIVSELRTGRGLTEDGKRDAWAHSVMQRSADEIESLRAELAATRTAVRLDCEMSEACCQCQGLRAELAALKEAADAAARAMSEALNSGDGVYRP